LETLLSVDSSRIGLKKLSFQAS